MTENANIRNFIRAAAEKNGQKAQDLFSEWGLNPDLISRYGIGLITPEDTDLIELYRKTDEYDPQDKKAAGLKEFKEPKLVIPYGADSFVFRTARLKVDVYETELSLPRIRNPKKIFNEAALHTEDELQKGQPVFLCWNLLDALLYLDAGTDAVYFQLTFNGQIVGLPEYHKAHPINKTLVLTYPELPDPGQQDEARRELTKIRDELARLGIRATITEAPSIVKESSLLECYKTDRAKFESSINYDKTIVQEKILDEGDEYRAASSGAKVDAFREYILNRPNRKAIKTGFRQLDELLGGGLYQGLYVLGAVSSLGKTAFCLQIADQIAERGQDVLFFTLEQSEYELMARSVSRITYLLSGEWKEGRSYRDIMNKADKWDDKERESVFKALEVYRRQTESRLYFIQSAEDIQTKEEAAITGGRIRPQDIEAAIGRHEQNRPESRPIVIIDYLQIIDAGDPKLSDKQKLDLIVSTLRRISIEHDITILAISSLNRENYNAPVEFTAFKESGIIEYSADVVIGLQAQGLKQTSGNGGKETKNNKDVYQDIRDLIVKPLDLVILKNRNGKRGSLPFTFNGMFSIFWEGNPQDQEPEEDDNTFRI